MSIQCCFINHFLATTFLAPLAEWDLLAPAAFLAPLTTFLAVFLGVITLTGVTWAESDAWAATAWAADFLAPPATLLAPVALLTPVAFFEILLAPTFLVTDDFLATDFLATALAIINELSILFLCSLSHFLRN